MMMRKTLSLGTFLGVCLAAQAVTYISDDFNDGVISSGWTIANATTNSTATENGGESDFSSVTGGGSLKLDDRSNSSEVWLQYVVPGSIGEGESLTVQFDFYSVDATLPMLYIEDGSADAGRLNLLGDLNHRNGSTWDTLIASASSHGNWYRITYTYHNHAGADKADITFQPFGGSVSTWTGLDVQHSKSSVDTVTFGFNTGNQNLAREWWIDNVTISDDQAFDPDAWFSMLRTTRVESDPSYRWRQFGPGMSGNNYRIYWHPTDPAVVFLGPNMGNAYRSEDYGTTYEGILDYDDKGHAFDTRGPSELNSPDFSRQNPDIGFCSREGESKLYKTNDRGKTWTYLDSFGWDNLRLNTIAVAPSNDQIWYVGSGDINDRNKFFFTAANSNGWGSASGHFAKIWKSTNQGLSWSAVTPSGIQSDACIVRLLVHPDKPGTVWAATTHGFYTSTNGGSSWIETSSMGMDHGIVRSFDMHYDDTTGDVTLYAIDQVIWGDGGNTVTYDGGGVFKSTDEGETWVKINGDLGVDVSVLKSDYQFKNTYFKALEKWFEIPDAESVYTVYPTHFMNNFSMVRVDPNDPEKIYILNDYKHYGGYTTIRGGMVWRTDDGGSHWFATLRNGTAWEDGGTHQAYWEGRGNPTEHNMFLRGQKKWEQRESYERKAGSAIEFNADGSVLMFQWAKTLVLSLDGGDTWFEQDEIEVTPHSEIWVAAENSNLPGHGLIQDPRFPHTIFLPSGENDFWVLEPGGDSVRSGYQAARRIEMGSAEYSCSSLAIHPNDTNTIYTLQFRQKSAGDLLKSTDGGQTFVEYGLALEWPPGESENDSIDQLCLTINPDDPDYMFFCVPDDAAVHGYVWDPRISLTTGVRRTTDGGLNWEWANNGLPTEDVVCLRLDPNNSSNLYACVYGNNGGLYVSTDHAVSWSKYTKLPTQIYSVSDIHFSNDGKIYVSCGRHSDDDPGDEDRGGVWVSDDEGDTWTQIFKTYWARMARTAAYDPNVILVQMNSKGTLNHQNPGTYLSKDGGVSWIKINRGNPQSDRINEIAIDQVVSNRFYVSTQGCGWLRGDLIDPSNVAPEFSGRMIHSNAVPEEVYADMANEAIDANGDGVVYSKTMGPDWLNVNNDGSFSALAPPETSGIFFCQIQADDGVGMSAREVLELNVSTNSGAYYASWTRNYPTLGHLDQPDDDPDGDGVNNLGEYGLGGDPAEHDQDILPVFGKKGGALEYVYRRRADADTRGLIYELETTTNLISNVWTNTGYIVEGIGMSEPGIESVSNTVSTVENNQFLRLQIKLND